MKMQTAMDIINLDTNGYMVHFEEAKGGMLHSGYFPDKHDGEELIKTEKEAWDLLEKFAAKTRGRFVNLYVIDSSFSPVGDYKNKMLLNR